VHSGNGGDEGAGRGGRMAKKRRKGEEGGSFSKRRQGKVIRTKRKPGIYRSGKGRERGDLGGKKIKGSGNKREEARKGGGFLKKKENAAGKKKTQGRRKSHFGGGRGTAPKTLFPKNTFCKKRVLIQ